MSRRIKIFHYHSFLIITIANVVGFIFQALVNDIPVRNLVGIFDLVNDSLDFVNDSRSANPTPSVVSNRSGFQTFNTSIVKTIKYF